MDVLLDEADRALNGEQPSIKSQSAVKDEGEYDALQHFARVLLNHPVPPRTTLHRIEMEEDKTEVFRRRGLELRRISSERKEIARPRILCGVALIIVNTCPPQTNGLSTHEQFTSDVLQLEGTLPSLGFEFVEVKVNLTRSQVKPSKNDHISHSCSPVRERHHTDVFLLLTVGTCCQIVDELYQTCVALCPGGNLEDADGFLVLILSTGGPTSFDTKHAPGANAVAHGASSVGFQEIVNLVKVVPNKPKVVLFNICGDPEERKKANIEVPLRQTPCVPNLYQKMLDNCEGVLLVLSVTSGTVNWVPKAGSLVMRFFLEEMNEEGIKYECFIESVSGYFWNYHSRICSREQT